MSVAVVFFTLTDRASTIPSNIRGCKSLVVRGLLDRKKSEEHLQSSNESMMKTKQNKKQSKDDKKKGTSNMHQAHFVLILLCKVS